MNIQIIFIAALTFIVVALYIFRKKNNNVVICKKHHIAAFLPKLKLARKEICDDGGNKFIINISRVLREYLSDIYHVDALSITTEELVKVLLADAKNELNVISNISEVLRLSDMVKFSQRKLSIMQQRGIYKKILRFILSMERKLRH